VDAVKQHLGGGAILDRDQVFNGACEIANRRMHRPQIDDEAVRTAQLRPERGTEDEIRVEDVVGGAFVGAIPDLSFGVAVICHPVPVPSVCRPAPPCPRL